MLTFVISFLLDGGHRFQTYKANDLASALEQFQQEYPLALFRGSIRKEERC